VRPRNFGPAAPGARQVQGRGRTRAVLLLQRLENGAAALVLVVRGVTRQADAPVLVAVPAVVKDVRLRLHVGINRPVDVFMERLPLGGGPVLVAQIVYDGAASQVVGEGRVSLLDGTLDVLHGFVDRLPAKLRIGLDGAYERHGDHLAVIVRVLFPRDPHDPEIRPGTLSGQLLQPFPGAEKPWMPRRNGMSPSHRGRTGDCTEHGSARRP